jgi:hypothetical protein
MLALATTLLMQSHSALADRDHSAIDNDK